MVIGAKAVVEGHDHLGVELLAPANQKCVPAPYLVFISMVLARGTIMSGPPRFSQCHHVGCWAPPGKRVAEDEVVGPFRPRRS